MFQWKGGKDIKKLLSSFHSWNPLPPPPSLIKRGFEFSKFAKKGGFRLPIKREGLVKQGVVFKREVSPIFILTNPFQCYLSLSVWYVCFVYLHHFYQYYLEPSLIATNQQIYNFYKWIIFEKKRLCGK